jgi:hypothetical protein
LGERILQNSDASRRENAELYLKLLFENLIANLHQSGNCLTVIPGRRAAASPESITTIGSMDSGPAPRGASSDVQLHIGE